MEQWLSCFIFHLGESIQKKFMHNEYSCYPSIFNHTRSHPSATRDGEHRPSLAPVSPCSAPGARREPGVHGSVATDGTLRPQQRAARAEDHARRTTSDRDLRQPPIRVVQPSRVPSEGHPGVATPAGVDAFLTSLTPNGRIHRAGSVFYPFGCQP